MSDQIAMALKRKLEVVASSGVREVDTQRNVVKEELQYYVLNFIHHHPKYEKWIMYGGSALRICHDLDRMSVDLDFEIAHPVSDSFLETLQRELEVHFPGTYGSGPDFITTKAVSGRGLLLRFHIGNALELKHPSSQVHVKIDLNHFVAPNPVIERVPINRGQLSFVIRTYNMATLMASKIAAIFLRGRRGVGTAVYEEKGRDIYDLLWYMTRKIVPDLNYLRAKGVDAPDPRGLFDRLTIRLNEVNKDNLRNDLTPLFLNRTYIEHWLDNWPDSYLGLLDAYEIKTVGTLKSIHVLQEFPSDTYSFVFAYDTRDGGPVSIVYALSDHWVEFGPADLGLSTTAPIHDLFMLGQSSPSAGRASEDTLKQYATLFHSKTEAYLERNNRVILGKEIRTRLIRMTADRLDQKEQIVLNLSALLGCKLEDLLK
jgi:predicted nucleotidyltransferase component of viral defense system